MKYLILVFLIILTNPISGQELHDEVTKVFDFNPHKMSSKEQKAVYPKLDDFFDLVIQNKEKYIEPLRNELKRNDNNPYFYFDGGLLLMEISNDKNDMQLVADALVKTNLKDLSPKIYLQHILRLSIQGADVIDAALHILDDPSYKVFIPQHSLTLKYGEALSFILPRYCSDLYIDKLISKFNTISSVETKSSCLSLFFYASSCKADSFLNTIINDSKQPVSLTTSASKIMNSVKGKVRNDNKEYNELFNQRKKAITQISDEVLYEINAITMKMRKVYSCEE
jgi:hypothetical protein